MDEKNEIVENALIGLTLLEQVVLEAGSPVEESKLYESFTYAELFKMTQTALALTVLNQSKDSGETFEETIEGIRSRISNKS